MGVGAVLVQGPGGVVDRRPHREVVDDWHPHIRVSFQTESQDINTDEEDRDYSYPLHTKDQVFLKTIKEGLIVYSSAGIE